MGVIYIILQYADDVTMIVAHEDPEILTLAANKAAEDVEENLTGMGLKLSRPKSHNTVISPGNMVGGVFRRSQCDTNASAARI